MKNYPESSKQKMRERHTGKGNPMFGKVAWNKGKKWSKEIIEKFRKAHLGKKLSDEHKKKIGLANIGRRFSKETIEKIRQSNLGKKRSEETRRRISETHKGQISPMRGKKHKRKSREKMRKWHSGKKLSEETIEKLTGEKHWRYIHDRSKLKRNDTRTDPLYREWRKQVLKRDRGQCRLKDENCVDYLIVHHIKRWSLFKKLRYVISNGITLCRFHDPNSNRIKEKRLEPILKRLVKSSN